MQNRFQYILASWLLFAALGALNLDSLFDAVAPAGVGCGASQAWAQDDNPFGDDPVDDPFAADEEDDPFATPGASAADDSDADADDEEDDNPFSTEPKSETPFAPSTLPTSPASTAKPVAPAPAEELTPEEQARADERAKYARAEDVPDDLKTEADFYETANAAELSVLRVTPTNDAEWFVAAVRVARVGRPAFAKILVSKALDAPAADPETSAKILDSLGSGRAIYFVGNPTIGPVGAEVYEKVLASARKYWESDAAIRDAFQRAASGSVSERAQGVTDARKGGAAAIKLLVADLVSGSEEERRAASELLPFFESTAVSALIACVRSAKEEQLPSLVDVLAGFADLRVGPELAARYYLDAKGAAKSSLESALAKQYAAVPSAEEFAKSAYEKALGYYRGKTVLPGVVDGRVDVWDWNAQGETLTCVDLPVASVMRAEAAQWALVSYYVGMNVNAVPSGALNLAIATVGERNVYRVGLDAARQGVSGFESELPKLAAADLVSGMNYALETGRYEGALIPAILLQDRGDESLVYGAGGPSAIVRAATCPDRRLRYQALAAIVRWNPEKSYPGSSRVAAGLEWFASSSGERVVVVAEPRLAVASQLGQAFSAAGYRVIPVTTGREALLAAQSCADVELVFATSTISEPNVGVLAQALRSDARTGDVPLLIGADTQDAASAANVLAGREKNVLILPTPRDLEAASWAIQKLNDAVGVTPVSADVRLTQSRAAARALLQLLKTRSAIYELDDVNELVRKFLATPALFDEGLEFAATVKTPYAQQALVDLAGDKRFGADVRNRAVDAFERQLAANGSLLRGPDIAAMYDRYNASEKDDAQTQHVLSRLLDVFESATKR